MKYKLQIEKLKQLKMDGNLAMANQFESEDEGYTPFEKSLFEQIDNLKKENVRLTKKLEYVYNKAYIIYHSANAEKCNSDIIKLWDAVEEFKPIKGANKYGNKCKLTKADS